jgi:hypothetical protein
MARISESSQYNQYYYIEVGEHFRHIEIIEILIVEFYQDLVIGSPGIVSPLPHCLHNC